MYSYGLIGNCQISALISKQASVDWLCFPRPDSPPVFGRILDEIGSFSITPNVVFDTFQEYIPNTNILVTKFTCHDGSSFQVKDFCPRFENQGTLFKPHRLFRIIEPLKGISQITVTCDPLLGWNKELAKSVLGSSQLCYEIRENTLRLQTNMPLTYIEEKTPFALNEKIYFCLSWGLSLEGDLAILTNECYSKTLSYWANWVKHCSVPTLFQKEVIRSALTLKLHCYEDTGAILAAVTTSLPESLGERRNWDYRYCWLRDAAFVLSAFQNLGHFEEMEGFFKFLLNIALNNEASKERLRPVYALDQTLPLPEMHFDNWSGYKNSAPVRSGNQACEHIQNDVYGEMILALAPIYFDERFYQLRSKELEDLFQYLSRLTIQNISKPDASLWELRNGLKEHSFSNLMCWAGLNRLLMMKDRGFLKQLDSETLLNAQSNAINAIQKAVKDKILRNGPSDDSLDSSLLLLPILRFPDQELSRTTVLEILKQLNIIGDDLHGFLYRYSRFDDFGMPRSAFMICSFWLVQALVTIGEPIQAVTAMNKILEAQNHLGLFSEHYDPVLKIQLGNFPQTYSHVGLINAAFAVSPSWSKIL